MILSLILEFAMAFCQCLLRGGRFRFGSKLIIQSDFFLRVGSSRGQSPCGFPSLVCTGKFSTYELCVCVWYFEFKFLTF